MPTEFDEFDRSPKGQSFDSLWSGVSDATVVDVSEMVRTADFAGGSVERALQDRTYAGSQLPHESVELRQHIKALVGEGYDYPTLEQLLKKKGYSVMGIRQQFQDISGIDPVVAYMDLSNYSRPPAELPIFNYGWGEKKGEKGNYLFILPYVQHYAIWRQAGFVREVVSEYVTLTEARRALAEQVANPKDVIPEVAGYALNPLIRIASLSLAAKEIYGELRAFPGTVSAQHKKAFLNDRVGQGMLTEAEAAVIAEALEPAPAPQVKKAAPSDSENFESYRNSLETQTLEEATEKLKVPQKGFDQRLETSHQVTTLQMAQKAFQKLDDMSQYIQGYTVKPVGHQVDLKNVEFAVDEGQEKIDTGSVSLIVEIQDQRGRQKAEALLIMFVVSGELMWGGTLKGSNNKEYALSQTGIDAYFQDLSGSSLANPAEVLPAGDTNQNQLSPDMAPLRY